MDFAGQSSTRTADGVIRAPFFRPVAMPVGAENEAVDKLDRLRPSCTSHSGQADRAKANGMQDVENRVQNTTVIRTSTPAWLVGNKGHGSVRTLGA